MSAATMRNAAEEKSPGIVNCNGSAYFEMAGGEADYPYDGNKITWSERLDKKYEYCNILQDFGDTVKKRD